MEVERILQALLPWLQHRPKCQWDGCWCGLRETLTKLRQPDQQPGANQDAGGIPVGPWGAG